MSAEKKHTSNQNLKIAVAYVRVSEKRQDETLQVSLAKKYAKENGLQLKEIFIEKKSASISSYPIINDLTAVFKNRPILLKIITMASNKEFEHLIAYCSDRLARDVFQNSILMQHLQKNKIQIHFTKEGENFKQNPMSQKLQNILACFAEYEASLISTRVFDMLCQKFSKGEWPGGRAPLGYKIVSNGSNNQLVEDYKDSYLIKEAFKLYSEGSGLRKTAQKLSENPLNIKFTKSSIERIISNKTYFGKPSWGKKCGKRKKSKNIENKALYLEYNSSLDIAEKEIEPLIEFIKNFKTKIKDPQFFSTPYLLKDLLICSKCNKKMLPKNYGGNKKSVYRCPTKENNKSHNIIKVEDIESLVLKKLTDVDLIEAIKPDGFKKYLSSLDSNIKKLELANKNLEIESTRLKEIINNIDYMLSKTKEDDLIFGLEKYKHYYNNIIDNIQNQIDENNILVAKSSGSYESFSTKVDEILNNIPNKRMLCFLLIKEVLLNPDTKEIELHIEPKTFFK